MSVISAPHAVAVAALTDGFHRQPAVRRRARVPPHLDALVERAHDRIDAPVAVQVAEGRAAVGRALRGEIGAGRRRGVRELEAAEVREHQVRLAHLLPELTVRIHHVAAGHEQVLAPVVVEVDDRVAPAGARERERRDARAGRQLDEAVLALVLEHRHRLVRQRRVEDVGLAVVVEVARIGAHARERPARLRVGDARREAHLLEGAVAAVPEEVVGLGVVRHEHVGVAVLVEVGDSQPHALADQRADPRGLGDVREGAVALVAVERVRQPLVVVRMAVVVDPVAARRAAPSSGPRSRSWRRRGRGRRPCRSRRTPPPRPTASRSRGRASRGPPSPSRPRMCRRPCCGRGRSPSGRRRTGR